VDPANVAPAVLEQACQVLRQGGLVAFPTDTLYALGANALDPQAIERVLTVKGRHHGKPLSLLVPSIEAASNLAGSLPEDVRSLMQTFWPGALTVVVQAGPKVPAILRGAAGTVGVRMPAGSVAQRLLTAFAGPIIGTSANKAGGADPADAKTVQKTIGGQIDLILDGGRVTLGVPSSVIDCTRQPARILREGAIARSRLQEKIALA
ncbi:MAG TPA: L-threonylcarbamoyladenylate synthase, partial [Candidatus Methylomirabilis sp.]|nr:L-threonylcarbamoyladenylate synthase [Candidatus Methylomirabilis sp.]